MNSLGLTVVNRQAKQRGFITVENKSIWRTGTPNKAGTYVVAVLYKSGLGATMTQYYDPSRGKWNYDEDNEDVIAYIALEDILEKAGIEWPEEFTPTDDFTPDEYK